MTKRKQVTTYGTDLAYVHDAGFAGFADGSAPGLLSILRQTGIVDGHVVDLGCGSGIWAGQLIDAGYDVTGIDISEAMIALARRRAPGADFRIESFRTAKIPPCQAVTALGEVLGYLLDSKNNIHVLRQVCRRIFNALAPGGLLIFDVAEVGLDVDRLPTFFEGKDWTNLVRFEYDGQRHQLTRQITTFRQVGKLYRRHDETHRLQLYRQRDVAGMLREIGFRVRPVRRYGEYALPSRRVGFLARKPG